MSYTSDVYDDLIAEGDDLDQTVAALSPEQWALATPAPGWTIKHQVAHLASMARIAGLAASAPEAFEKLTSGVDKDFDGAVHALLTPYLSESPEGLLARWRSERGVATRALAALPPDQMLPWVARPIPAGILASAGYMELFAHGRDIMDTLREKREYGDRIRHLAEFAVRNRDFGYLAQGITPPTETFRFELTAPSGVIWKFGPDDAEQSVTGPAVDFCLLVTRRRHRDDLAIRATGKDADHWLNIAQAYRGSPGHGRTPGQFGD